MKRTLSVSGRRNRIARFLMSLTVAGSVAVVGHWANAGAGCGCATPEPGCGVVSVDCGCEVGGCDCGVAAEPTCGCGVAACGGCKTPHNPLYRTLDAVAGGIEKVLGFDKCKSGCNSGCDSNCDDACDAGYANELMNPIYIPPSHSHGAPSPIVESIPSVPPLVTSPPTITESVPMYSQPRSAAPRMAPRSITPADSAPGATAPLQDPTPIPQPEAAPEPGTRIAPPTPPETTPPADSKKGGFDFDSLDDPFGDDEVRANQPYRRVHPISHERLPAPPPATESTVPFSGRTTLLEKSRVKFQDARRRYSGGSVRPASHDDGLQPLTDPMPHLRSVSPTQLRPAPAVNRNATVRPVGQVQPASAQEDRFEGAPAPLSAGRVLAPYRRSNR
ncbi:hypothetical protein [Stieleria varia]|uniref:Uncharacterized protein n=1 Tax=Stieleria varia TaxID=2528005 RepID=A0A5C6A1B8_9BACT|nr:hypothetical protein [Stieleria varia]TWT93216.1 hypothetical protein Pla52n_58730 [Stieleria varia]